MIGKKSQDPGTERASDVEEGPARGVMQILLYYVAGPLAAIALFAGLFVFVREFNQSPCYRVFTWQ